MRPGRGQIVEILVDQRKNLNLYPEQDGTLGRMSHSAKKWPHLTVFNKITVAAVLRKE